MGIIREGFDLGKLAQRVEGSRNSAPGERVSFDAHDYQNAQDLLAHAVEFDSRIPAGDRAGLVWGAVVDAAQRGVITSNALAGALRRAEAKWLTRSTRRWSVVTRLTMRPRAGLRPIRVGSTRLQFYDRLPVRYDTSDVNARVEEVTVVEPDPLNVWVRASVLARTDQEAYREASDALDLVRGLWNYRLNRGTGPIIFASGVQGPINLIRPGPVYTLHESSGSLATTNLWYEGTDRQHRKGLPNAWDWNITKRLEREDRAALRRISYRDRLEELIRRYVRALDSNEWDVTLTRLWSVLEALTGIDRDRHASVIRRTMFLIRKSEGNLDREILREMKERRDGLVHHDMEIHEPYRHVTRLKWYAELLLNFHLRMGPEFTTMGEACGFLDLSRDRDQLERKKELVEMALKLK